ncbi:MAG: metallophosphoesterase [Acidobacteria bacterium]|nr:metallophosphoesterase [Acidobacteriota bacterium]
MTDRARVPAGWLIAGWLAVAAAAGALSCGEAPFFAPSLLTGGDNVLVGAGDIGDCTTGGADQTAALLALGDIVFTAGDNAYPRGSVDDFRRCYDPSWGPFRARTRPSPGNHDYETAGASAYFSYFGANAGPSGLGYYSFPVGDWTVLSLNSNIAVGAGSAQAEWVRRELERIRPRCLAAIWHHAFVSSGAGADPRMRDLWRILQAFGAELVIAAHDHFYERLAPVDASGNPSSTGIRPFIVGTGGAPLTVPIARHPASEVQASRWGVLRLILRSDSYQWAFVPVSGGAVVDTGTGPCR